MYKTSTLFVMRLLNALKKSAEAGLRNAQNVAPDKFSVDEFNERMDAFRTAVVNLQRFYRGNVDDVDLEKIKRLLKSETHEEELDEQIKVMLDYGYTVKLQEFTEEERRKFSGRKYFLHLYDASHPSDELLNEIVEIFKGLKKLE